MPRREHDDRYGRSAADRTTDIDTGHVRQAQVEDDEIGPAVRRRVYAARSIRGFVDARGDFPKRVANGQSNLGLVVDHEYEIGIRHAAFTH